MYIYIYIYIYIYVCVCNIYMCVIIIPKTQKMVLNASLLNTQQYKLGIKGKVEHLSLYLSVVAIVKEAFGSPTLLYLYIYIYIYIHTHKERGKPFVCIYID